MRTAREIFQATAHKAELEKIVQNKSFESACQTALLTLMEEAPYTFDTQADSWQVGLAEAGARRVLEILTTLHLTEEESKPARRRRLDYTQKQ